MELFDKLGKKASEAYKITADKTGKIAKETKIKFKIGDLRSQINDIYEEIGKKVYERHVKKEEITLEDGLKEECTKIDVLSDEIERLLKECLELKDKKQCQKCFTQIEREAKFCSNCGEKQEDMQPQDVELIENNDEIDVDDNDKIENQIDIEEVKKDSFENLEKTVKIESNVDLEDDENED